MTGLWVLPLSEKSKPVAYLVDSSSIPLAGAVAPDSRYAAYGTADSTQRQVFVQTFPDPSLGKWPLSGLGGGFARWSRDGKEIFFVDAQGRLVVTPVRPGPRFEVGEAKVLFPLQGFLADAFRPGGANQGYPYDVTPDGQRFVTIRLPAEMPRASLTVLAHWNAAMR